MRPPASTPIDVLRHKGEFFSILAETNNSQIAIMTLEPGGDSGPENIHPGDQIVYMLEGTADIEIDKQTQSISAGHAIIIPQKTQHHVFNNTDETVFLITIYAPPAY